MWEEDPKWQQAKYRAVVYLGLLTVPVLIFISLWLNDRSPALAVLETSGILLAALCIYAALVWTIGNSIKALWRLAASRRQGREFSKKPDR
jgi:hypothetical protein